MLTGLTELTYEEVSGGYSKIGLTINGKLIYVPIIGSVYEERDKQLCAIINDLIKRELE